MNALTKSARDLGSDTHHDTALAIVCGLILAGMIVGYVWMAAA